jgi:hypothetical protein
MCRFVPDLDPFRITKNRNMSAPMNGQKRKIEILSSDTGTIDATSKLLRDLVVMH